MSSSRRSALLVCASVIALSSAAACNSAPTESLNVTALAAKGGGGGGGGNPTPTPTPAPVSLTGVWTGENRWGPAANEARRWTLTLQGSGAAFTGRLVTEQTLIGGGTSEGEGNISVNGTLSGSDIRFTMQPKRGGSFNTFIGTLGADGRTMRGVNWVATIPSSILGDTMTLAKQ